MAIYTSLGVLLLLVAMLGCVVVTYVQSASAPVKYLKAKDIKADVLISAAVASEPASSTGSKAAPASASGVPNQGAKDVVHAADVTPVLTSFVAVISGFLIAVTVLAIGVLRMSFSFARGPDKDGDSSTGLGISPASLPSVELVKTVGETLSLAIKAVTGQK